MVILALGGWVTPGQFQGKLLLETSSAFTALGFNLGFML